MAPKKGTDRVVKSKTKPTTTAVTAHAASKVNEDLHLMLLCLKSNGGGQIDYQAVADALGITKSAAKQRFYKIRNLFEGPASRNGSPRKGAQKGNAQGKVQTEEDAEAATTEDDEKFEDDACNDFLRMNKEETDNDLKMNMEESEDDTREI